MSGIRVTYSGLIAFVVGILGIITGLVFTMIITRSLTLTEFGSWSVIGSLVGYPIVLGAIVSYWTTREIARGIESGKTALVTSAFFSIIGMGVYLVIIIVKTNPVIIPKIPTTKAIRPEYVTLIPDIIKMD